jgi:putative ABC transport system permease protein
VGSKITIYGHTYSVAGRLDPSQNPIDHTLFMGLEDAYALAGTDGVVPSDAARIAPGQINAVFVHVDQSTKPEVVGSRIKAIIPQVVTFGKHFTSEPVDQEINGIPGLLNSIAIIVTIASLPLIALISAMVAHERQHEIGILKSIGATKKIIFGLVMAESLALAFFGGLIGVGSIIITFFLMNLQGIMSTVFQLSFNIPAPGETVMMSGIALCTVIIIGSVASLYPAYTSSIMNPYDAIRQER